MCRSSFTSQLRFHAGIGTLSKMRSWLLGGLIVLITLIQDHLSSPYGESSHTVMRVCIDCLEYLCVCPDSPASSAQAIRKRSDELQPVTPVASCDITNNKTCKIGEVCCSTCCGVTSCVNKTCS